MEHFLFCHILGIILPTDFHIFQGVGSTTNQFNIGTCQYYIVQYWYDYILFQLIRTWKYMGIYGGMIDFIL
jgi:hypothetical protein